MVPYAPTSSLRERARYEPLYDIDPRTGASFEVFYADRTLETFGRCGLGWFWWSRRAGFTPSGAPTGPFATSYAAYRHALGTGLGATHNMILNASVKSAV
jgi:hypothetical protein